MLATKQSRTIAPQPYHVMLSNQQSPANRVKNVSVANTRRARPPAGASCDASFRMASWPARRGVVVMAFTVSVPKPLSAGTAGEGRPPVSPVVGSLREVRLHR